MILVTIFEIVGAICLCLVMLAVAIAAFGWAMTYIHEMYLTHHSVETKARLQAQIDQINAWCGYEWPVVKEVLDHLNKGLTIGGYFENVSQFRNKLREKYPNERTRE